MNKELKAKKTIEIVREPLYCVTGINRLVGERQIISRPMLKEQAEAARERYVRSAASKKPYKYCKVELYSPQLELFNN